MYRVVGGPPASPSGTTNNNTFDGSASSCTPSLLQPGPRSDDERFGSSIIWETVQRTGKVGDNDGTDTSTAGIFGRGARRQDNSRLETVFLLVNYTLGSVILNTPQTFKDSGLVVTTVLYFITCELSCTLLCGLGCWYLVPRMTTRIDELLGVAVITRNW